MTGERERRRSLRVTFTLAAAMIGCGKPDPCDPASFDQSACQGAIVAHPQVYSHPYPYYYGRFSAYRAANAIEVEGAHSGSSERGGFGATGEAHGGGAGE